MAKLSAANKRRKAAKRARRNAKAWIEMYAQPYDPSAKGWYFKDAASFDKEYKKHLPVEEYEIEFIDGTKSEAELFEAMKVNQANLHEWFDIMDNITHEHDQAAFYYLASNLGRDDWEKMLKDVDDEVRVMEGDAKAYIEDYIDSMGGVGQLGKETIESYFDYDSFGRDIGFDMDPDDEGDKYYLDMDDAERGEAYVDSVGFEALGEAAERYFDVDRFARDAELSGDIAEFQFDGKTWTTDYHG